MLETIVVVVLIVCAFIAGLKLDDYYHTRAARESKDALERQYVRLKVHADADDPCRPYVAPSQPLSNNFMNELKQNGRAKAYFKKSDVAK